MTSRRLPLFISTPLRCAPVGGLGSHLDLWQRGPRGSSEVSLEGMTRAPPPPRLVEFYGSVSGSWGARPDSVVEMIAIYHVWLYARAGIGRVRQIDLDHVRAFETSAAGGKHQCLSGTPARRWLDWCPPCCDYRVHTHTKEDKGDKMMPEPQTHPRGNRREASMVVQQMLMFDSTPHLVYRGGGPTLPRKPRKTCRDPVARR